jgi:hypothetical protein
MVYLFLLFSPVFLAPFPPHSDRAHLFFDLNILDGQRAVSRDLDVGSMVIIEFHYFFLFLQLKAASYSCFKNIQFFLTLGVS